MVSRAGWTFYFEKYLNPKKSENSINRKVRLFIYIRGKMQVIYDLYLELKIRDTGIGVVKVK